MGDRKNDSGGQVHFFVQKGGLEKVLALLKRGGGEGGLQQVSE